MGGKLPGRKRRKINECGILANCISKAEDDSRAGVTVGKAAAIAPVSHERAV